LDDPESQFSIFAQPGSTTVAPDASVSFTVRFEPTGAGAKNAEIIVASNDANEKDYSILISGTARDSVRGTINLPSALGTDDICSIALDTEYGANPSYTETIDVPAGSTAIAYEIEDVPNGDYLIWASIDTNRNSITGDPGDFLGTYGDVDPNIDTPNASVTSTDRDDLDITMVLSEPTHMITDAPDDVSQDFIDIVSAEITINWSVIYCELTVQNIPDTLTIDNDDITDNHLEYGWMILLDVDKNGKDPDDYEFSIRQWKDTGEAEKTIQRGELLDYTQEYVWIRTTTGATGICILSAELEDTNRFIMHKEKATKPELKVVTETTDILIETYYDDGVTVQIFRDYWP
jgi:hypothetical protein